jgi:hypothetical protein
MLFLLLNWTIGTYTMWLCAHITMQRRGRDQVAGGHKAVLELANAMQAQTKGNEGNAAELAESGLQHRIAEDRGGAISYEVSLLSAGDGDHEWVVAVYLEREKWWLAVLIASCAGSITLGAIGLLPYAIFIVGLSVALILSISVGTTQRSKGIILWWSFWVLCVVPQTIAFLRWCSQHRAAMVFEIYNVGWLQIRKILYEGGSETNT